jgi:LPS O-antigen subunit length determinant protein (WzzB/FepE family)
MDTDQLDNSRETGRKVWESLMLQMAEGHGFLAAMLGSFRHYLRKNLLWYLLCGLLAAAVAAGIWFMKPKVYEAEMTVSYVHYEKKIYADMLRKLDMLIKSGDEQALAERLNMPASDAKALRSVTGMNIRDEDLVTDLSTEKIPFYIKVKVTDPGILGSLQPAIVNYLNNTEYIRDRLDYMLKRSQQDLNFLERRLAIVDSLSSMLIIRKEGINDEKAITRMELLQEALALHDRIQQVKGSMEFNLNIEVLDGFVSSGKPAGTGLKTFLLYGFLAGAALWFVIRSIFMSGYPTQL